MKIEESANKDLSWERGYEESEARAVSWFLRP